MTPPRPDRSSSGTTFARVGLLLLTVTVQWGFTAAGTTAAPIQEDDPGASGPAGSSDGNGTGVSESLRPFVRQARAALLEKKHAGFGALVYHVRAIGVRHDAITPCLHYIDDRRRGTIDRGNTEEGPVWTAYEPRGQRMEIKFTAPGHHATTRQVEFRAGHVDVWDIVLEPVTLESGARVTGSVWLEDDDDPAGITVKASYVLPESKTVTDADGRFSFLGLPSGLLHVRATKEGYVGLSASFEAQKRSEFVCPLRGFRQRTAAVRWAYQPAGSRRFSGDKLEEGASVLSGGAHHGMSFAPRLDAADGEGDFGIVQTEDQLVLSCFGPAQDSPGVLQLARTCFDDITEAPQDGYATGRIPLKTGDVFILRCSDGKHYAKMEVLAILDGIAPGEVAAMLMRSECILPGWTPDDKHLTSLAVIDFDTGKGVAPGTGRALSDLARGVVADTGRFLLLERDSIIHVLGEEDFMASVKCDDTRCVVNYGAKLRAQKIMHGRISRTESWYVLTLKLIDVGTGTVEAIQTEKVRGKVGQLVELVEPKTCALLRSALSGEPRAQ